MSIPNENTQGKREAKRELQKSLRALEEARKRGARTDTLPSTLERVNANPDHVVDQLRRIMKGSAA